MHHHSATTKDRSCLNCHTPHTAPRQKLLARHPAESCLKCHDRDIVISPERTLPDMKKLVKESKSVHEPVAKGECQECHDGHGSVWDDLLRDRFSTEFYQPYTAGRYSLCFKCHDRELAETEKTTKTAFRDGLRNLHFVHVNRVKGRSCAVCHEAHGSVQEKLMKPSTPFGPAGWPLTIEFKKTTEGGQCASACHVDKSYDRRPAKDRQEGKKP